MMQDRKWGADGFSLIGLVEPDTSHLSRRSTPATANEYRNTLFSIDSCYSRITWLRSAQELKVCRQGCETL